MGAAARRGALLRSRAHEKWRLPMARTRAAAETRQKNTKKTTKTIAKAPTRKTSRAEAKPPGIRGEKRVKETKATVSVGPARRRRGTHDGPTVSAAVDRRKQ